MARELTEKQTAFLDVLFDGANGDVREAMRLAGYSDNTTLNEVCTSLKEEIIEATTKYLSRSAPRAATGMVNVLIEPTQLGSKEKLAAAKEVLDRVGIVKTEKMELAASGGIALLPPKRVQEEDDQE